VVKDTQGKTLHFPFSNRAIYRGTDSPVSPFLGTDVIWHPLLLWPELPLDWRGPI